MDDQIDQYAKKIWDYMHMHQELRPMDAIFALGSTDTRVATRAGKLYLQGYGKLIICAGGTGKVSGFDKPEAEIFAEVIYTMGVPKDAVLLETQSTNTGENILFVKQIIEKEHPEIHSFLLVQKPYMERRTYATFTKQWPGMDCIVTSPLISYEEYARDELFRNRFIDLMVGDLQRIREYPKLGFQIEQEIPDDVWHAWKELVQLGFTKYYLQN